MDQEAKIIFYKIEECGYYKFRSNDHVYGDINLFLSDLKEWSSSRNTKDTKLFEPEQGSYQHPIYLADLKNNEHNDWVVVLWNEVPTSDGNVMSLPGLKKVGNATLNLSSVGPDDIPGFPTFFWFISDSNLIATINMNHSYGGKSGMNKYIYDFIKYHTPYAKHTKSEDSLKKNVVAYLTPSNNELLKLKSNLKISPIRILGNHEKIINSANEIARITTKAELNALTKNTKALWQKVTDFFEVKNYSIPTKEKVRFESSFEVNLTEKAVREIIQGWEEDGGIDSGKDYGFEFKKNLGKKLWLGESFLKTSFNLNFPVKDFSNLNANHLLHALDTHKKHILEIVPKEFKIKESQKKIEEKPQISYEKLNKKST
ncbi:hypothetical protein [Advenella sp. EE-W14]|uniref:hypothetical protein n=1 Tax=Advenella sp. EE-W14 TaxID=2722705 RepID=UPI00145DFD26|nr:hypothetical protein [Advenella sp. EE-W14]